MAKLPDEKTVNRRHFLQGSALGAAALVTQPNAAQAQEAAPRTAGTAPLPSAAAIAAETGPVALDGPVLLEDHPGADFMMDVLKSLGFEYAVTNPASSLRGLHESMINYSGNKMPELLTCCHEEAAVAMADGYARVTGKPMAVLLHGTVGLQHGLMNIYNAYVARSPVYIILGNALDAVGRRPGVEWDHSALDVASIARDFIKWDDTPGSLTHFGESAVRAYKIAMAAPQGPVILTVDNDLQEEGIHDMSKLRVPKLTTTVPPAGEQGAVQEAARLLVGATNPLILCGESAIRTQHGMDLLVELAETLQAPVDGGKMPSRHSLNGTGSVRDADVILGLQMVDFWGAVNNFRDQQERVASSRIDQGTKLINISAELLDLNSNYQNLQRYTELDLEIAGDAEATLPSLIEACKQLINAGRRRELDQRGERFAAAHAQGMEQARLSAATEWDLSPISRGRLHAEMWEVMRDKDWVSLGGTSRLWNIEKHYQTVGGGGAAALGSGLPVAMGAALGHRPEGRLCVNIQPDGDFMYVPGSLWTAAHHRIPYLTVMWNNRAYHQEVMHITRMALRHQRGGPDLDKMSGIGTKLHNPNIDYASIARGMGVFAEGPITNPHDLGPALKRAVDVVMRGEPALVDVVTQPR